MSLSVIIEEPSGFRDDDLQYMGRVSHNSPRGRSRVRASGGGSRTRDLRYGPQTGRYSKGAGARGLGGLRFSQTFTPGAPVRHDGGKPNVVPIRFIRNPRHPKSLYNTEISMRNVTRGRPLKVSPDMAFPDPREHKSIRNPLAPRFRHEFDVSEATYNIARNPLSGASIQRLGDSGAVYNQAYTADDDINSSDESSGSQTTEFEGSQQTDDDDDVSVNDSASRIAIYSDVNKYRVPEPPPVMTRPPHFTPRPSAPPPALIQNVPSIPRVVAPDWEAVYQQHQQPHVEVEEVPPIPEPLDTLAEEDETQDDDEESQVVRDMSTQTAIRIQPDHNQTVNQEEAEAVDDEEERFVDIQEERRSTMTHDNWEVVAPWSQTSAQVTRSPSLAVNYRRVVAELSGDDLEAAQQQEAQTEPQTTQPQMSEDPPPWSPPITPQIEQILHPMHRLPSYPPPPADDWDHRRRGSHGGRPVCGFWNACCFIVLMLFALVAVIGAAVVTALYVLQVSNCSTNCGLPSRPGYLAGFVAAGALAILVVLGLITWCCYNLTVRQRNANKHRMERSTRRE
ncbi:uncharacterized protein [Asterias amurensis]|uniref:uncharacterized protein n=1 Tax=Asterias amurensis TaxID=7602 RepID=UPI003AB2B16B